MPPPDRTGTTARLVQLCGAYFGFYVLTGVLVKFFLKSGDGFPGMGGITFLTNSTLGANAIVGMRFTTSSPTPGSSEVLVFGTAVVVAEPRLDTDKVQAMRAPEGDTPAEPV